jgi:hypothetical protein
MKLVVLTIVLDGMPWITRFWPELEKLSFDWQWHVVEGVAAPDACTSWCREQVPRLSEDGTTGYLDSIASFDPRVILHQKELWHGKVAMVNEPLSRMTESCLLLQADSDELWTAEQLTKLRKMFLAEPNKNAAYFRCRYRVGRGIEIVGHECYGNQSSYEWLRAWRWEQWMKFKSHEPPVLANLDGSPVPVNAFLHKETEETGLVFRHEAWSTEAQVRFKCDYYGSPASKEHGKDYEKGLEGWRKLQANRNWPVQELAEFLPWVGKGVKANQTSELAKAEDL